MNNPVCFRLMAFLPQFFSGQMLAQVFDRSELSAKLDIPWEIQYGSDKRLWISQSGGRIVRVNPLNGASKIMFTAPDYFNGSPKESSTLCFKPKIGAGTLGMALHPNFKDSGVIFLVYSYNHQTLDSPQTRFKIAKLRWDKQLDTVVFEKTLVNDLPNGYDHLGGRLICVSQNKKHYLYYSAGDNGISETSEPLCYSPQSSNPNNFAQDIQHKNGKIHRFNLDGSIPADNPVDGNSVFTRGHRNPQGLAWNPRSGLVYCAEHGDRTDDEINLLKSGKNYGWKQVRGYHSDNNFSGEAQFVSSYAPDPKIKGDSLMEPLFSWCNVPQPLTNKYTDWCTVAPSDLLYYNANAIKNWKNSLLVVTLKKSETLKQCVYRFQLQDNGEHLSAAQPNPELLFEQDFLLNGRLRDLTFDTEGENLYTINNGGTDRDKIICYKLVKDKLLILPNPAATEVEIKTEKIISQTDIFSENGQLVSSFAGNSRLYNITNLTPGLYFVKVTTTDAKILSQKLLRL
jgi:glucose/arabinose dehydrogenase